MPGAIRKTLRGRQDGFSLIEIIVTLSIFSILVTIGALQMGNLNKEEKMRAAQAAVSQILEYTRVQAVTRGASWSTLNTLTTAPYAYDTADATLSNFITKITESSAMGITVSPETIAFDARGLLVSPEDLEIVISSAAAVSRAVNVSVGGVVSIPSGHPSGS